jgi:putative selenate reductase molybdopterin-binding subunit
MAEHSFNVVGQSVVRVDGRSLVTGDSAFTDDFVIQGLLIGKILRSPHAHARIKSIDASAAEALEGVHAVLTHNDVPSLPGPATEGRVQFPRRAYTRAGQDHPEPSPWDSFLFDQKVRYIGDRVAAVAAESEEIAEEALKLIKVDYEVLPHVIDPMKAMSEGAPVIHDEQDLDERVYDRERNICSHKEVTVGDMDQGFADADIIVENTYNAQFQQHAQMELHITITYFDEHDRLIVRSSTQVPFHVRRQVSQALGMPISRIRVIKPRIGGGFGGKQEMVLDDVCAALTVATHRPVKLEMTREEDLTCARCRHPMILTAKTGVKMDGSITANQMTVIANAGAYGSHSPTVPTNTGNKNLPRYKSPNIHYSFDAAYTNLPITGAMRGYGTPQGTFAMECQMDEVAEKVGIDPVDYRKQVTIGEGDMDTLSPLIYEVGESSTGNWKILTCGLPECLEKGAEAANWYAKRKEFVEFNKGDGIIKKGIGMACVSQGSGVANIDTANATIKINEDGSFNLMIGAADLGTGGDTVLSQIAAETLGVTMDKIILYPTDTDISPFDSGAYASSTTFVSGNAVKKAAEKVAEKICAVASKMSGEDLGNFSLSNNKVISNSGKELPLPEVASHSIYVDKVQIEETASHVSPSSPPPFGAQFAEVEVDIESGQIKVTEIVSAIDAGTIINPALSEGQVEGAVSMSLGYALVEELQFDETGKCTTSSLLDYRIIKANQMPKQQVILIEPFEPTGPYGVKAIAEIPTNGPAPAIANAVYHAIGVRLKDMPFTPEKVLRGLGVMS